MTAGVRWARRIAGWTRYLEEPRLLRLRRTGVSFDLYRKLDKPWLQQLNIKTVLDVGANVGEFALAASLAMPNATIYSFEPLTDCFQQLQKKMLGRQRFEALNLALGEESGTITFQRNASAESSSFLQMTEVHKQAFPGTRESRPVKVRIERLDDVASKLKIIEPLLIKIDVQGYEDRVLRGARNTIQKAKVLIVETSFVPLYEGQPLFQDIWFILRDFGFQYSGVFDQIVDPATNRVLQADSIFMAADVK